MQLWSTKPLQISIFWLSNALFQLELIRIVALEEVAGSSPVGHPKGKPVEDGHRDRKS